MTATVTRTVTPTRAVLLVLVTMLLPLLATTGSPAQAARPAPSASPARAIGGERVTLTGAVPAPTGRVVRLERQQAGRWKSVATGRSAAGGRYTLTAPVPRKTPATVSFRVVAPEVGARPQVVTGVRKVRVVQQVGTIDWRADAASVPVQVTWTGIFTPVRPGRAVVFQERRDDAWVQIDRGTQDARGRAVHEETYVVPGRHAVRAVTLAAAGAPAKATPTTTYQARLLP